MMDMNVISTKKPAVAVLGAYTNYRDLRVMVEKLNLSVEHVVRAQYRESLGWIRQRINEPRFNNGLPLLFAFQNGEILISTDHDSAEVALERIIKEKNV